jgi:hypothetical protein
MTIAVSSPERIARLDRVDIVEQRPDPRSGADGRVAPFAWFGRCLASPAIKPRVKAGHIRDGQPA